MLYHIYQKLLSVSRDDNLTVLMPASRRNHRVALKTKRQKQSRTKQMSELGEEKSRKRKEGRRGRKH